MIGAGDVNRISTFTIEQYLRGTLRFTIPGGLSYVDARDVVEGLLLLEGAGISGRRYVLTSEDGNLSHRDFFGLVGEVSGKKRLTVPLPPAMLIPSARVLAKVQGAAAREAGRARAPAGTTGSARPPAPAPSSASPAGRCARRSPRPWSGTAQNGTRGR